MSMEINFLGDRRYVKNYKWKNEHKSSMSDYKDINSWIGKVTCKEWMKKGYLEELRNDVHL